MPKTGTEAGSIENTLREFVVENFLFGRDTQFPSDESFIGMGILDSTGVLELVAFVEKTFGVQVDDHELVPENMDSIDSLVRYVQHKRSSA